MAVKEPKRKRLTRFQLAVVAAIILLAGGFAFVVLPGLVPDPGHPLIEVQGYFSGDASLEDSLEKLQQRISDNCSDYEGISSVGLEGTVGCETGLQQRINDSCPPGENIWRINADGTVDCDPDETSSIDPITCPSNEYLRQVNIDGSAECVKSPGMVCTWAGNTYSTGQQCNASSHCFHPPSSNGNKICTCQANGGWNCLATTAMVECPPSC